jgi:hypothetical protein
MRKSANESFYSVAGSGFFPPELLFLKFVAQPVESSHLLGGPGFSPAEGKFLSIGFSR